MAKQTFTTGQVLTAAQMTSLQQTAMGGGSTTAKTTSYTLVAADAGTVVQMNSASATTITVNTALFAAGDTVEIQNMGAGVCTVTAGTATVNTSSTLALKQYDAGSLYFNSTSAAVFFAADAADSTSPLTTKGDLYTFSTADARLGVGTNGQTLVADSTASTGLKWATAAVASSALTLVKAETAFTAVANTGTTFDGVFSSSYNNYLIIINKTLNSVDSAELQFNMRYAGPTTESAGANTGGTYVKNSSGTDFSWYFNNATTMKLMTNQSTAGRFGTCNLWVGGFASGSAARYQMNWQFATPGDNTFGNGGNVQNNNGTARVYTGFILTASSGTISGTATVYGYGIS